MRHRLATLITLALVATLVPLPTPFASAAPVVPPTVAKVLDGLPASARSEDLPDEPDHEHGDHGSDGALTPFGVTEPPRTSQRVETPIPFGLVGFELPRDGVEVSFRTSVDGRGWTEWTDAHHVEEEGPDPASDEAAAVPFTEPVWVGEARHLQVAVSGGSPTEVGVHLIDSSGLSRSPAGKVWDRLSATIRATPSVAEATEHGRPPIVSRAGWGADESLRRGGASYASDVLFSAVHHTVSRNDYACSEAPAIIRGIYRYHVVSRGWKDIGYNFLVDRCGTVYEGRHGGVDRAVIGAHAAGFNTGSTGVSVIGTLTSSYPSPVLDALNGIISWKFALHHVDPTTTVVVTSRGSPRYPSGTQVRLNRVVGHRDIGRTSCPGDALYAALPTLRSRVRTRTAQLAPHYPQAYGETPFEDIGRSTHAPAIESLYLMGVTTGCAPGRFCPGGAVTRAQMATFLVSLLGLEPIEGQRFPDVPLDHPHAGTINAAHEAGILSGNADGSYSPDRRLSRAQMAVLLQQALGLELVESDFFVDLPLDETLVRPRANAIRTAGITDGCQWRRYCPSEEVTREQLASFLFRAIDTGLVVVGGSEDAEEEPSADPTPSESPSEDPSPSESPSF